MRINKKYKINEKLIKIKKNKIFFEFLIIKLQILYVMNKVYKLISAWTNIKKTKLLYNLDNKNKKNGYPSERWECRGVLK